MPRRETDANCRPDIASGTTKRDDAGLHKTGRYLRSFRRHRSGCRPVDTRAIWATQRPRRWRPSCTASPGHCLSVRVPAVAPRRDLSGEREKKSDSCAATL